MAAAKQAQDCRDFAQEIHFWTAALNMSQASTLNPKPYTRNPKPATWRKRFISRQLPLTCLDRCP